MGGGNMIMTKEGVLASFYTVNKAPIKHLRVYFSPKQAGSGDPSPENVREISGWNGVEVYFKKNLLNLKSSLGVPDNVTWSNTTKRIFSPGQIIIGSSWSNYYQPTAIQSYNITENNITQTGINGYGIGFTFKVKPNEQYQLSGAVEGSLCGYVTYYKNDGTAIIQGETDVLNKSAFTVPIEASIMIITFAVPSVASVKTATITNPALQLKTEIKQEYEPITTSFPSTIYGGYVDLITGELVQTHYGSYINRNTITYMRMDKTQNGYTQAYFIHASNNLPRAISYQGICNRFNCSPNSTARVNDFISFTTNSYFMIPSEELVTNDIAGILDWFDENPTFYVMQMATTITHQLTPIQLQTFIGQNNIWSNADRVEVEYELAESNDELYRRRNIILNSQPHLITPQTSPTQAFVTDIAAPLNEYKIYFGPTQDKSSIPTLSNIKAIDGHTAIPLLINNIATSIDIPFKVYGGYIDIKRQKLVITAKMYELDGSEDEGWAASGVYLNRYRYRSVHDYSGLATIEYGDGKTSILACDQLYVAPNGTSGNYSSYTGDIVTVGSYNPQLYIAVNSITTLADWTAHLNANPLHLVGKMVTPIEYDLDLTNLKTVQGLNEITNLTYDKIELSYWSHYDSWPKEYERVDYLQGIGDRTYIDTGIAGDDDTIIMDFTIMPITRGSYSGHIVGNHNGEDKKCWRFIQSASTIDGAFNFTLNSRKAGASPRSPIINDISTIINNKFNIRMQYNLGTVIYDGVVYTTSTTETTEEKSNLNIIIGANGPNVVGGTSTVSYARFYNHFKIQKQGAVVRDYIPCIRKSDNKPGFYDLINKTFNPSLGDRDFIAGNDS